MINVEKLRLRKVQLSDALLIYKWAISPDVRMNSLNQDIFTFENHLSWFKRKINDSDTKFFILEEDFPIGQIRFDKTEEGWLINFMIDENFRGNGFGFLIVKMGITELQENSFIAYVKEHNIASNNIFKRLQFKEITSDITGTKKWIKS